MMLKTLVHRFVEKNNDLRYATVMNLLRTRLSLCLLRWNITCLRGSRSSYRRSSSFANECHLKASGQQSFTSLYPILPLVYFFNVIPVFSCSFPLATVDYSLTTICLYSVPSYSHPHVLLSAIYPLLHALTKSLTSPHTSVLTFIFPYCCAKILSCSRPRLFSPKCCLIFSSF